MELPTITVLSRAIPQSMVFEKVLYGNFRSTSFAGTRFLYFHFLGTLSLSLCEETENLGTLTNSVSAPYLDIKFFISFKLGTNSLGK